MAIRNHRGKSAENNKQDFSSTHADAQIMHTESGDIYRVRKRKTKKPNKKLPYIVLAVLLIFVGAGAAFGLYFLNISSNLKYTGDALDSLTATKNTEEPFYALIIGSDKWEDHGERSDAMILARVDLDKSQITTVSIPRDTPTQLDGETVKMNEVYSRYGDAACVKAISEFTGVPINHYVCIEFDQLKQVVDSMDGVMVDVPYAFDYEVYTEDQPVVHVDAGMQLLNGDQAVALSRMRTAYAEQSDIPQDAIRQANIRAILTSLIKSVIQAPKAKIPAMVKKLSTMVKTDIPLSDLTSWAMKLAKNDKLTIYSVTGPVAGDIDPETGLWLTYEQPEQWKALMAVVDAGEDPTEIAKQIQDGVYSDENVDMNTKTDVAE